MATLSGFRRHCLSLVVRESRRKYVTDSLVAAIRDVVGESNLATSLAVRQQHQKDESYHIGVPPDLVVFPQSTQNVSEVLSLCNDARTPVIPWGTGTGIEGGSVGTQGTVSVDMSLMKQIVAVNAEDFDATVQSGVTRLSLNEYLRDTGLWFPVDPGADASLCGMCATSASGTNAVRYGTMRENVLNLEVVLADGRIIHTAGEGRRTKKTSAGYNLTNLFVGSEGTLGIITSATLRLHGIPESVVSAVCQFNTIKEAVDTTVQTLQSGIPIARIELLDEDCIRCVNNYSHLAFKELPSLFLEFHGSEKEADNQARAVADIIKYNNGSDLQWATDVEERNRLWKARHNVLYAILASRPNSKVISTDVCVPISLLPECILETKQDIAQYGIPAPLVGHVGDGNFHINFNHDPEDKEEFEMVKKIADRIVERALAKHGTCTGEHGIGLGKTKWLVPEIGDVGVGVMKQIKEALDPNGIMNPGKVLS